MQEKVNNHQHQTSSQKKRKQPIFDNDVSSSDYKTMMKEWLAVDEFNVGKAFQEYQIYVAEETNSREIRVESDTYAILALSNILLIKYNLENVIRSVIRDEFICKQAPKKTHLLTTGDREAQPYDMLLLGVRNLIESISKIKAKETLHENKLSCAFDHSVLNPLFSSPDSDRLLTCNRSNVQVLANDTMQPDLVVNSLFGLLFRGLSLVVDVKGEDHKENAHDCLVDLIRICMISGDSINKHNFDGAVGLHVVGLQISFYIITLMPNGIFVMLEIGSVSSPIDFTEMKSYITTMEDILFVIHYYDCCSTSLYVSSFEENKKDMLKECPFFNMINCGKSKKKICNNVLCL